MLICIHRTALNNRGRNPIVESVTRLDYLLFPLVMMCGVSLNVTMFSLFFQPVQSITIVKINRSQI